MPEYVSMEVDDNLPVTVSCPGESDEQQLIPLIRKGLIGLGSWNYDTVE